MRTFPMFLTVAGRRIVILGGGEQAAQKCRLALKTEAEIVVGAPLLEAELHGLARQGRIQWHDAPIAPELFDNAALVFVATGCPGADMALHAVAKASGAVVNVVDAPDLCDAMTPSIVDRDPVVVAIGTEGAAPVLARQIKTRVEEMLAPRLGELAALAGRLRARVAERIAPRDRRPFWSWVFNGEPHRLHASGDENGAARLVKQALEDGQAPGTLQKGFVSLVGAGPGSADLITLRGVQRLQEADIIFYDRLVDPAVLELARRDAERVYVGKTPGVADWPQDRINALIVSAARQGQRVVRLKCGDPNIFARGAEEAHALDDAGVGWEVVPGVTAATAAASAAGGFLTERGLTDTLVLTTGRSRDGAAPRDWAAKLQPGTTLAIYMGVAQIPKIARNLMEHGIPSSLSVEIIGSAGTPDERVLRTTLRNVANDIESAGIKCPAMIILRHPITEAVWQTDTAA